MRAARKRSRIATRFDSLKFRRFPSWKGSGLDYEVFAAFQESISKFILTGQDS